jgi:hypothetical protein
MYTKFLEKIKFEFDKSNPSPDDILAKYPDASDFDKCILLLRSYKLTYGQISSKIGSPSKKSIRESLLKYAPELIEEDCNRNKLQAKERASKEEFILINLIRKHPEIEAYYMGNSILGYWKFVTVEGRLYYIEEDGSVNAFGDYDYVCQYQFLEIIKQQLNGINQRL